MKIPLIFSALALTSANLHAGDWPYFLGPKRDNTSAEKGLIKSFPKNGPKILWKTELNEGFGGAAVVGDEIFIVDRVLKEKDILLCLNLKDGKKKWQYETPNEKEPPHHGSRSAPTVEKDAVYFICPYGDVIRVNRKTHKADWKINLKDRYPDAGPPHWGYAQNALIIGDTLIVTPFGEETGMAAWDKKTGKELWKTPGFGNSHSTPTPLTFGGIPQILMLNANDSGLSSFDVKTGKKLWQTNLYQNQIPITTPVQIDKERLFVSGGYNAGSTMLSIKKKGDEFEIEQLWKTKKGSQIHVPLLIDKHLYFLANENSNHNSKARRKKGGLVCFDLKGKMKWSTGHDPFMGRGSSLYADGMLIIQDGETGVLRLVDPSPKKYKLLAEANVFSTDLERRRDLKYWSNLALSNGKLIMRGQGHLLCVEMKK